MSLRLVGKKQGRRIIGIVNGKPVYGISGATPEGDDNGGTGGTGDSGDGGSGDGGSDDNDGSGDGTDGGTDDKGKDQVISKEEYDKALARMKAADKNNAELQKQIKEYQDKERTDLEKATNDLTTVTAERDTLAAVNKGLQFDLAFALNSKHSWQDPAIVMDLVRKAEGITMEEDGTIKGMNEALDKIAKEKPFLLKEGTSASNDDGKGGGNPTGTSTGSGKKPDGKGLDEDSLRKKYPALNL